MSVKHERLAIRLDPNVDGDNTSKVTAHVNSVRVELFKSYLGPADVARRTFRAGSSDMEDGVSISIARLELNLSMAINS